MLRLCIHLIFLIFSSENCSNMDSWWSFMDQMTSLFNNNPRIPQEKKQNLNGQVKSSNNLKHVKKNKQNPPRQKRKQKKERFVFWLAWTKWWSWWQTLWKIRSSFKTWSWPRGKPVSAQRDTTALYWWAVTAVLLQLTLLPSSHCMVISHAMVLAQFPRKPIYPCDASRQTPRRPAVYSLDYICLPVCLSHYLCNVSMEMDGVLLGEDGA